jgi:ligand-binding sensor domain-containing protein
MHRTLGAAGDYSIDITTGEKGLPNSSVTAIAQAMDGYLWVGTYNGLARFDGERFVKFYPENTPALKYARIRRLVTGSDGTLWISAHDGSITAYRNGKFSLEWAGEGVADSAATLISARSNRPMFLLRTGEIIRGSVIEGTNRWEVLRPPGASPGGLVAEDAAGVLWCAGRDQKIYRLAGSVFEPVPENGGLKGTDVNVLTADRAGQIWAATDREIACWNGERFVSMTPTNGGAVSNVIFLRVLSNGDVWSIANERLRKSRGKEWVVEVTEARGLFTGARERTGLHEDAKAGVWIYD